MLQSHPDITVDDSANEWDLYNLPGRDIAAIEINGTLMNAVNSGADQADTRRQTLDAMRRYEDLGAMDSEPLSHLVRLLDQIYGRDYANQP